MNAIGVIVNTVFDGNEGANLKDDTFVDGAKGIVVDNVGGVKRVGGDIEFFYS